MTTKSPWSFADVLQRHVGALVPALAVLVVQHRVAMREGAAARVLAGQAHVVAVRRAATRRRGSRPCPSRPAACPRPSALRASMTRSTRGCSLKPSGTVVSLLGQALQLRAAARACRPRRSTSTLRNGAQSTANLLLKLESTGLDGLLARVERRRGSVLIIASGSSARDHALRDQLVGVQLARARVLRDLLVHQRLRDERLVLLVVAELAEADEVDHHVLVELAGGSRARAA